jgi:hypothetical protein
MFHIQHSFTDVQKDVFLDLVPVEVLFMAKKDADKWSNCSLTY